MAKSKNRIANDMYGEDFEDLSAGEKAAVTKAFNKQETGKTKRKVTTTRKVDSIRVEIGRLESNGVKVCLMGKGATVGDLLTQSNVDFDEDKEKVILHRTGDQLDLTDEVKDGELYEIAPHIKSA